MTTKQQFESILAECRSLFEKKLHDYGPAWRILRPSSLTDQIFIKAGRIRSIETKKEALVDEGIRPEFIGIVNYALIGLIQLDLGPEMPKSSASASTMTNEEALAAYDKWAQKTLELMLRKNHDYDEAWRSMRVSSYTDLILMKIFRTKQIESLAGDTLVSEGIDAPMVRTLLVNLCRLVLATVFILSGLVKIIDPRGFSYKIDEYAGAAGITDFHLAHASLLFAAAVAMLEFSAGIYLFFGIRRRLTSLVTLLMMTVFTALTFWSWRWHAVSDCGCFGDVIHLTPAETFFKNVVLLLLCLPLVRHPRAQVRFISEKSQWTIGLYVWIYGAALCAYNVYMLPVMDFRPYHIGADLLRAMQPADAGDVRYTHTFIMEKDGERREFSLEDYPDSTWTFVDRRTRIEGSAKALPPIHDLSIVSPSTGIDTTEALLSGEGWKFLIVAPDLREADDGVMERLAELTDYCSHYGYPLYCLTASNEEDIRWWQDITGAEYPYLRADRTPLRTMVRSNPGLVVLKGSTVKAKFPAIGLPSETELTDRADRLALLTPDLETHLRMLLRLLLWFVGPLFILTLLDNLYRLIIHIKNKNAL